MLKIKIRIGQLGPFRQRLTMLQAAATAQELVGTTGVQARCMECDLMVPRGSQSGLDRGGWAALLARWL